MQVIDNIPCIIEYSAYDPIDDRYDSTVFTDSQAKQDFSKAASRLLIPAPVRDYNTDPAIAVRETSVSTSNFVAEAKGSMSTQKLREIERTKMVCGRKFLAEMNRRFTPETFWHNAADNFGKLRDIVVMRDGRAQ